MGGKPSKGTKADARLKSNKATSSRKSSSAMMKHPNKGTPC